jgi:hypothetical protein
MFSMNSVEGYRNVVILLGCVCLIAGLLYLPIGLTMAIRPDRWPSNAFIALPKSRLRANATGMTGTIRFLVRFLGVCFSILSIMMLWTIAETISYIRTEGL